VADRANLESRTKLALPELAGERVSGVCNQEGIFAGRGKTRGLEPEKDEILQLEIILTQLDVGQSKLVRRKRDRRQQNVIQC
jgi:hypothetical protein